MNILFIVHRIPYPPNKGDKIRSFNEIKYLAEKHNLYLAFLVDDEKDLAHIDELRKYCADFDCDVINPRWRKVRSIAYLMTKKPLSIPYFYSKKLQEAIDKRLVETKIGAVICFSSPMAEYIFRSKTLNGLKIRNNQNVLIEQANAATCPASQRAGREDLPLRIMDFVDVDSDKWRMYAGFSKFPFPIIYKREWKTLMSYEQKIGRVFDQSIFVSDKEADLFRSFCPEAHAISMSNGVDYDFYEDNRTTRMSGANEHPNILFMGAMDYFPNEDAVLYFCLEVWPIVKKELPGIKFYIVGGKPSKKIRMLGEKDKDIVVTGHVPDVTDYLRIADVFVAPLRIARGIQNKVLEAMAAGVPVVARPEAVQGLSELNGCITVEEDSAGFAQAILKIVKAPYAIRKSVGDVKEFVEKNHNWGENLKKLDNLLNYKEAC